MFYGGTKCVLSSFEFACLKVGNPPGYNEESQGKERVVWIDLILRHPNRAIHWDMGKAASLSYF